MYITMKYNERDFFNERQYVEITKRNPERKDVLKCFRELKKSIENAVDLNKVTFTWDTYSEWENGTVYCIEQQGMFGREMFKCTFEEAKKIALKMIE